MDRAQPPGKLVGPSGFTNTFNEFDPRQDGRWSFVMHGHGKGHYLNECEFIKIDEPALIAWKRFSKPLFNVVVLMNQIPGNKTQVIYKMIFDSVEECKRIKSFAGEKNEENFDRLEKELAKIMGQ